MDCDKETVYKELYYALFRDIDRGIDVLQKIRSDAIERYLEMGDRTEKQREQE